MKNWFNQLIGPHKPIALITLGLILSGVTYWAKHYLHSPPPSPSPSIAEKLNRLNLEKDENGFDVIILNEHERILTFQTQSLVAEIASSDGSHIKAYRIASCHNCDARFELLIWNSAEGTTLRTPYPGEHTLVRTESDDEVLEKQVVGGFGLCGGQQERILIWQQTRMVDMLEGKLKPSSDWERLLWVIGFDSQGSLAVKQDQETTKETITQYFESNCQMIPPEDTSDYL